MTTRAATPFGGLRTYNANLTADAAWPAGAPPRFAYISLIPQTGYDSQLSLYGVFLNIWEFPTGNYNSQWSLYEVFLNISKFPIGN